MKGGNVVFGSCHSDVWLCQYSYRNRIYFVVPDKFLGYLLVVQSIIRWAACFGAHGVLWGIYHHRASYS